MAATRKSSTWWPGRPRVGGGAETKIAEYGLPFATLIDPTVDLRGVEVGRGVTIYRHATASALAQIGDGAVVFAGANAGHGVRLGAGAVLAPGAVVNARVEIGECAYIGTNAAIMPDLKIGAWATVDAASAVIQDVPERATVIGVPAAPMGHGGSPALSPATAAAPEMLDAVRGLWRQLLGGDTFGLDDNLFDVGGTPALAVLLQARLQEALGRGPSLVIPSHRSSVHVGFLVSVL